MKKLVLLLAVLVFTLGMSAIVMADYPDTIDESQFKMTWSDEFDGDKLSSWWAPQRGNGNTYGVWEWGNNEKEFYKDDNISVKDGNLVINAKYEPNAGTAERWGKTTVYNFSSGRVWSKDRIHLGYGYTEARISIPSAQGIWPAFWMLGTNGEVWPKCGEIDIMEAFNVRPTLQATIHYPDSKGADVYNYVQKNLADKTQFHTYGCYRDGNHIAFYIDREVYGSYLIAGNRKVLNDDYYLLLNVACGGNLAGGDPRTDLNVNMYVDYVRHYVDDPKPTVKPTVKPTTTAVSKPAKAKIKSLKYKKKRKLIVKLKKVAGAQGYQVRWCDTKSFDGYEQKTTKKPKLTIKGLDRNTKYWVKARAFKKVNGAKLYGSWSAKKSKKVKK